MQVRQIWLEAMSESVMDKLLECCGGVVGAMLCWVVFKDQDSQQCGEIRLMAVVERGEEMWSPYQLTAAGKHRVFKSFLKATKGGKRKGKRTR